MPGKAGKSGRKKKSGTTYRFDFYYRVLPGEDPPELEELLKSIVQARGRKRREILQAALLGGIEQGRNEAAKQEDTETASILDDMMGSFLV
jgi:hypothetical protein